MQALADAGYRAVAPDMRGYGGPTAPDDPRGHRFWSVHDPMQRRAQWNVSSSSALTAKSVTVV
jgi:pimeloyl-ACP methyl ester carboxylesterase